MEEKYFRTPAEAAAASRRLANDQRLASRLERLGVDPYRTAACEILVDLASEGSMVAPRGRPFIKSRLFNTRTMVVANELQRDLRAYKAESNPTTVAFITIRPSTDAASKTACS